MPEKSETRYFWMECKVCAKLHRGDVVRPWPEPTMRKAGRQECPDNPGRFADYTYSDWKSAAESRVDALVQNPPGI